MHLHIDMEKNQSKRKMGTAYEQALYWKGNSPGHDHVKVCVPADR